MVEIARPVQGRLEMETNPSHVRSMSEHDWPSDGVWFTSIEFRRLKMRATGKPKLLNVRRKIAELEKKLGIKSGRAETGMAGISGMAQRADASAAAQGNRREEAKGLYKWLSALKESTTVSKPCGILLESAKSVIDLPDGVGIVVKSAAKNGFRVSYVRLRAPGVEPVISKKPYGGVICLPAMSWEPDNLQPVPCDNAYAIGGSQADSGWGPLLYDVAMEVATLLGGGLTADRDTVSTSAHSVWSYYANKRADVKRHQLDDPENSLTRKPRDNCVQQSAKIYPREPGRWDKEPEAWRYTKASTQLRALLAADKLMIWNIVVPGFKRGAKRK